MPLRPVYTDPKDAVADIPDGSTILLGGFSAALGAPIVIMSAFIESTSCKLDCFISAADARLKIAFRGSLLIEAIPV